MLARKGLIAFITMAAVVLGWALLNYPVMKTLWDNGFDDGTYSHAYLIPAIILYLIYTAAEQQKLIFRTKHSEMFLDCSTKKYMSIYFYYSDFFQVVKNDRAKILDFKVMLRNLKINNRTISCQTNILTKSEMKSLIQEGPIALDLDYSKTNQFKLSEDKNKVFYLAYGGKRILEDEMIRDSEKFETLLQKYHIYRHEILELLKSKMKNTDT